MNPEIK